MARIDLILKNDTSDLGRLNEVFNAFAAEHAVPTKARQQCLMAFDDLVTNIVHYAYDDEDEHQIDVTVELRAEALHIRIRDDGRPFDPFSQEDADTTLDLDERDIGGLGIHLVRSFMDASEYQREDGHNVVRLTKNLT